MRTLLMLIAVPLLIHAEDEAPVKPPKPPPEMIRTPNKDLVIVDSTASDELAFTLIKPLLDRKAKCIAGGIREDRDNYEINWYLFPDPKAVAAGKGDFSELLQVHISMNRETNIVKNEDRKFFEGEADAIFKGLYSLKTINLLCDELESAHDNHLANASGKGESLWKTEGAFKYRSVVSVVNKHATWSIYCKWADESTAWPQKVKRDYIDAVNEVKDMKTSRPTQGNMLVLYTHRAMYPALYDK